MGFVGNYLRNLGSVALGREPSRPLLFSYYVTHRCAWSCVYCCDGSGAPFKEDEVQELSTADAGQLLAILRRAADTLDITGGEPMMRRDLEAVLEKARSLGFRTALNTKGVGLPDRPEVLRFTDVLALSVDALDPAVLTAVMGGKPRVAEGVIEALRFAMAERGRFGTRVVLSTVATPDNLDEAGRVLAYTVENRLGFHISPQIVGTAVHPALRDNPRYRRLMEDVLTAKRHGAAVLGVAGYYRGVRDFSRFQCHPLLMPTIRPDGRMYYPCLESGRSEVNLLEAGAHRAALVQSRRSRGPVPDCSDCCHVFCHMALSLLQRQPLAALGELRAWRS
jgi:MoaA/NifB/PqqE/SkfB family radical SAM enzyme